MNSMEKGEEFENTFLSFVEALKVLSFDAEEQCEVMGNYNVPWEIQDDVLRGCHSVARSPSSYLTPEQTQKVEELAGQLQALPVEAVAPMNVMTDNNMGSIICMRHEAWNPLRQNATELLRLLRPAIERNQAYFQSPSGERR